MSIRVFKLRTANSFVLFFQLSFKYDFRFHSYLFSTLKYYIFYFSFVDEPTQWFRLQLIMRAIVLLSWNLSIGHFPICSTTLLLEVCNTEILFDLPGADQEQRHTYTRHAQRRCYSAVWLIILWWWCWDVGSHHVFSYVVSFVSQSVE